MTKKELAVGDSTELEIIYSTGRKIGPSSKRPAITTNEGPPTKHVTIKTHAIRQPDSTYPVILKPFKLFVSRAGEIEIDEAKFEITNVSDEDLNLTIVDQPYGYFQLDVPKTIKAGKTIKGKLKVNPEYLKGSFEKSITFEFSDAAKSRFTLPVVRRLIGQRKPRTAQKAGAGQHGK